MPRILEIAQKEPTTVWVKLPKLEGDKGYFYIYTPEEVKDVQTRAIRNFCLALADTYIEEAFSNGETK